MVTTKELPILLKTVADNSDTACRTGWSQRMNRAFETVIGVGLPVPGHLESLIVIVATSFALGHCVPIPSLLNSSNQTELLAQPVKPNVGTIVSRLTMKNEGGYLQDRSSK